MPSGQDALKLKAIMRAGLGARKGHSATSYPKFDPHITIASFPSSNNIPLSTIRTAVPASQGPILVEFESIAMEDHFFRPVYLAVKPTAALFALREHVYATLGLEPRPAVTVAFPHISLCYIDKEDARHGEREKFLRELDGAGRIKREDGRVGVNDSGGGGEGDWLWGFEAAEVWIADCDGPISGWSVLAKIPLATESIPSQ